MRNMESLLCLIKARLFTQIKFIIPCYLVVTKNDHFIPKIYIHLLCIDHTILIIICKEFSMSHETYIFDVYDEFMLPPQTL